MSVQNFWIESRGDRHKPVSGGSGGGKDDRVVVRVMMRENGASVEVLRIEGFGNKPDGTNALTVRTSEPFELLHNGEHHILKRAFTRG